MVRVARYVLSGGRCTGGQDVCPVHPFRMYRAYHDARVQL